MRKFGKVYIRTDVEPGDLAWAVNELVLHRVEHHVYQPENPNVVILWFTEEQCGKLPYYLGVRDPDDESFELKLPIYSQIYFYKVGDLVPDDAAEVTAPVAPMIPLPIPAIDIIAELGHAATPLPPLPPEVGMVPSVDEVPVDVPPPLVVYPFPGSGDGDVVPDHAAPPVIRDDF